MFKIILNNKIVYFNAWTVLAILYKMFTVSLNRLVIETVPKNNLNAFILLRLSFKLYQVIQAKY